MDEIKKQNPPCVSYKTFDRFLSKFHQYLPTRFDRNYWGEMFSGNNGVQLDGAMQYLNLIDNDGRPTPRLKFLTIATGEHRLALMRQIAYESYSFLFKAIVDIHTATYNEMEDVFQTTYDLDIASSRKSVKFFAEFAKDANIVLSSQISRKTKMPSNYGIKKADTRFHRRNNNCSGNEISAGEFLKEELAARNISRQELAKRAGMPLNTIDEIVSGKKVITAEAALQLEEVIPTFPARFWLYLQSDFLLKKAFTARHP
jgi:HTH-type transcriptional regulator/antitoxin HigA